MRCMSDPDLLADATLQTRADLQEARVSHDRKLDTMAGHVKGLLECVGEDPGREGLLLTPMRVAKSLSFLTDGYTQDAAALLQGAMFQSDTDEMVVVKDIELYSMCEHHLLPFIGKCHVAYIPDGKVIGLSKIARLVDVFARRLQIRR